VTLKFEQLKKEIQEVVLNTAHESAKKYSDALKANLEINTSSIGTQLKSMMNDNNAVHSLKLQTSVSHVHMLQNDGMHCYK